MSTLEFRPNLTPTQMLEEGIFGGSYFGVEELEGDYDYQSLFQETLSNISPHLYLGNKYRPKLNKFKVRSGMPFEYWVDMKWMHADDPYGWFEWYIKYFNGRRHPDDDRQIGRWQDFSDQMVDGEIESTRGYMRLMIGMFLLVSSNLFYIGGIK